MAHTHDVLIIGQGVAGTALSEALAARGLRVAVFDTALPNRASIVAPGLVNPVVLRRIVPSWRAQEMLSLAEPFYRALEQRYGQPLWHAAPMAVIHPTAQEAGLWQMRLGDPALAGLIAPGPVADPAVARLIQPYGHGACTRCAWVDVKALLRVHRERWQAAGRLVERFVAPAAIERRPDGMEVQGLSAPMLVHCAGPFARVPGLVPVRGEGLTVRIPGLGLAAMAHRGFFLVPLGDDAYRIGATFAWDDVWRGPTDEGRHSMLDRLRRVWEGEVELLEHWAGVRPASQDRRPILGRIGPHEAVLNGLGARGVMLAPWCAEHLADHLIGGRPLDPEVDAARFT